MQDRGPCALFKSHSLSVVLYRSHRLVNGKTLSYSPRTRLIADEPVCVALRKAWPSVKCYLPIRPFVTKVDDQVCILPYLVGEPSPWAL